VTIATRFRPADEELYDADGLDEPPETTTTA
jgi:hypothetical protein